MSLFCCPVIRDAWGGGLFWGDLCVGGRVFFTGGAVQLTAYFFGMAPGE